MNSIITKLVVAGAFVAATLTTGCASLGTEGASEEVNGGNTLQSPYDNVAIQQMKDSSYAGGE
jgi:hypothetical protein